MIRLFITDDHPMLRQGLRLLFAREPDLHVVGEADNGQALLDQLPATPADVVLLDMTMPVLDGVATTRQLRHRFPALRILMLSMVEEPRQIGEVLAAGAHGYLLKNASTAELLAGIRAVLAGELFLCSEVGLSLLRTVLSSRPPLPPSPLPMPPLAVPLSRRELEVLQLVAAGLTTQQVADRLFTSKRTVETQRQSLLNKVGVNNTAALISYAHASHLLAAPPAKPLR